MKVNPFNQPPPVLGNQFDDDHVLREYLERVLPADVWPKVREDLHAMGEACRELDALSKTDRLNEPVLTQWDAWGQRIDEIELTKTWQLAERVAAEHGVVAAGYEDNFGAMSRVHQYALAYIFAPASDFFGCPLAMTDGAAATLIASGNQEIIDRAVPHLTSRSPEQFWTSGQWMTESTGGSDVGRSETIAEETPDGWRLSGRKWFTSAATSQIAITLGRPVGNPGGGHGLALFYVECEGERGKTILVNRLKDKLGTRKVPTAELTLDEAPAELVLGTTGGVKGIIPMLNVTRTWNAITSTSLMRRGLALAKDYAKRRVAFGAALSEQPLHIDTLATLSAEYEGALLLAFRLAELLGAEEHGDESGAELLRLLTPIAKLTTGKQVAAILSEVIEAFGGAGYVEDTGLPTLLRDGQVLPIWEGTTNVLSLDLLRAISRGSSLATIGKELDRALTNPADDALQNAAKVARAAFAHASEWLAANATDRGSVEAGARRFALTLGRTLELAYLIEQASWDLRRPNPTRRTRAAALRFAQLPIDQICDVSSEDAALLAAP